MEFVLFDWQTNVTVAFSGNEGETPFTKSVRDNHVCLLQIAPLELLSVGVQTICTLFIIILISLSALRPSFLQSIFYHVFRKISLD